MLDSFSEKATFQAPILIRGALDYRVRIPNRFCSCSLSRRRPKLGCERIQITLIVLAPFLAIGFIKIGETAGVTMRKVTSKLGFGNSALVSRSRLTRLLAIYLVLFMLLSTGFLFALTEGYQNIALSNQVDGVFNHQTIVGATWQASTHRYHPPLRQIRHDLPLLRRLRLERHHQRTPTPTARSPSTRPSTPPVHTSTYATFAGDVGYYRPQRAPSSTSTSAAAKPQPSQPSQANLTNVGSVAQTITLFASTTTPAVGQPVTFTATLTSRQSRIRRLLQQLLTWRSRIENKRRALCPPQNGISWWC